MSLKEWFKKIFKISHLPIKKEKKRTKLIFNPLAGEGKVKKAIGEIKKSLKNKAGHLDTDIFFSRQKGDMANCAKEAVSEGYEIVIVAGGDGAINEVVQGLANSEVALGIIPLGTANTFAQEVGIPPDIEAACEIIGQGKTRRVDLGRVGERYFLWQSGVGADALVAQEVHGDTKEYLGTLAYLIFTLRHLKKIPYFKMKIQTEENVESFPQAVVAIVGNATTYDGNLKIKSVDNFDDGYLDIVVARKITVLGVIRGIIWFALGRRAYYRDVKYFDVKYYRAKKIKIESEPKVFVHTDGEIVGETPQEFTIAPKSLTLILP